MTTPTLRHLFSPITLGPLRLANRLVMPPMSINFGVDEEGFMTEQHTAYLKERSVSGTAMITVGGGAVDPIGLDLPRMPPIWDDRYIPALQEMTREVKAGGAFVYLGDAGTGLDLEPTWSYTGTVKEGEFAYAVAGAGDVSRDGIDDIVVGARKYTDQPDVDPPSQSGAIYVFYGADGDGPSDAQTLLLSARQ